MFRKVLFWMHLTAGTVAGVVVLIMSITGVALMYEKQMMQWADQRGYLAEPPSEASRRPVEELIARAREKRGTLPSTVTLRSDPKAPIAMAYGREGVLYLNAYTGRVLGEGGASGLRSVFRLMTDWHRWLGASTEGRAVGKAITGVSNLAFLFIVLSGLYLWWPRKWTWQNLRSVTWFKSGLPGKARDFNWHNVIGLWCWAPLVLVVSSATIISYPWASNLAYRLGGSEPPGAGGEKGLAKAGGKKEEGRGRKGSEGRSPGGPDLAAPPADLPLDGLDTMLKKAEARVPNWYAITLRMPSSERAPVLFMVDRGYGGQPQKRTTLTMNRRTREIERAEAFTDLDSGRRFRTWLRFVHTGEYYGLAGQTVAGIASLGGVFLVYTGIALALRRFWGWRKRRTRAEERVMAGAD
jgi:uncharacterized iron-regulated membrane protein